jgi:archaellum component FlaG (FlaF/FlaG flagellin family)
MRATMIVFVVAMAMCGTRADWLTDAVDSVKGGLDTAGTFITDTYHKASDLFSNSYDVSRPVPICCVSSHTFYRICV